jgi:hypothetical protein
LVRAGDLGGRCSTSWGKSLSLPVVGVHRPRRHLLILVRSPHHPLLVIQLV